MKKLRIALLPVFVFTVVLLSSCSKDEPFVPAELSFAESTITVNEADGVIEIEVVLDKPVQEDITIEYSIGGTALEKVANPQDYDYTITSDFLEVDIDEGETTGIIEITLRSDFSLENPEEIQIELESVDSESVGITNDDDIEITIEQEDGMLVLLEWGVGVGENYTDVDMDLFLWAEDAGSTLQLTNLASYQVGFTPPEFFFLPTALLNDGSYGLSCNYYEGTEDPMNFLVSYIEFVDGDDVSTVEKNGQYTLANINPWDTSGNDPVLVFTFEKSGADFLSFSDITVPGAGSRVGSSKLPAGIKRK